MWADVDKRISRALGGIRLAFRAVISRVNSGPAVQLVQADGLAGERLQDNELMQHYGLTSNPPAGTMAVVLPVGGRTSHGIIVATEHGNYRLKSLESGEVALYTDEGTKVVLKRGRIIETDCDVYRVNCRVYEVNATDKSDFNTPMLTASQELTAQEQIHGNGGMAIKGGDGASFEGDVNQTGGNITTNGDVTASGKSLVVHRHNETGGTTSTPI